MDYLSIIQTVIQIGYRILSPKGALGNWILILNVRGGTDVMQTKEVSMATLYAGTTPAAAP